MAPTTAFSKLIGSTSVSSDVAELTIGSGLAMTGSILSATGSLGNLTGNVTSVGLVTTIPDASLTLDQMAPTTAFSKLIGSTSASSDVAELTIGSGLSITGNLINTSESIFQMVVDSAGGIVNLKTSSNDQVLYSKITGNSQATWSNVGMVNFGAYNSSVGVYRIYTTNRATDQVDTLTVLNVLSLVPGQNCTETLAVGAFALMIDNVKLQMMEFKVTDSNGTPVNGDFRVIGLLTKGGGYSTDAISTSVP
jgi:hypothetical protein